MKYIKKRVQNDDGSEQEVVEFLGLKTMRDYFAALDSYREENFGVYGKDYKRVIEAFPCRLIKDGDDWNKPLYQAVNVERFDGATDVIHFEIPKIPWE